MVGTAVLFIFTGCQIDSEGQIVSQTDPTHKIDNQRNNLPLHDKDIEVNDDDQFQDGNSKWMAQPEMEASLPMQQKDSDNWQNFGRTRS